MLTKLNYYLDKGLSYFRLNQNITARRKLYSSFWAIVFGVIITAIFLAIMGFNSGEILSGFITGAFSKINAGKFGMMFSVYVVIGIAVGIGFKVGLFNIGIPGQMMLGGIFAVVYLLQSEQKAIDYVISIIISILLGAGLALFAAIFKAFFNVHEVISTLLLNWVVVYIGRYVFRASSPFANSTGDASRSLDLPSELSYNNIWIYIVIFSVIFAFLIWIVLQKTTLGYKIKATGLNQDAAKYAGVNQKLTTLATLTFSGALSGLAGWLFYIIYNGTYAVASEPLILGFNSIAISLLAFNSPIGILLSSVFYTIIEVGLPQAKFIDERMHEGNINIMLGIVIYVIALSVVFVKFKPMHLLRKYMILYTQKSYWNLLKRYILNRKQLLFEYKKSLVKANQEVKANKTQTKAIKKQMKNLIDFKKLKTLSNEEKLELYEEASKAKKEFNEKLVELKYFARKNVNSRFRALNKDLKNRYKIAKNTIFIEILKTKKDYLYIPIMHIKKSLTKKGATK
ncbi:ABC transporter permease subunit [Candidatus Mycoplasma pogonae]